MMSPACEAQGDLVTAGGPHRSSPTMLNVAIGIGLCASLAARYKACVLVDMG